MSVRDQAVLITDRLRRARALTFRALTGDSPDLVTTVARFLALLELFREGAVAFEQLTPLGELTVRWTGADSGELEISDEFDDVPAGRPPRSDLDDRRAERPSRRVPTLGADKPGRQRGRTAR